jgi:hypothetical protein
VKESDMKTSELTGAALDWAVLEALKPNLKDPKLAGIGTFGPLFGKGYKYPSLSSWKFDPSTNWAQGGPIIERERIDIRYTGQTWDAARQLNEYDEPDEWFGSTPLIAAMRCYVASRLGDEVDIPEELK